MKRPVIVLLAAIVLLSAGLAAQTKAPATFADYGKWETLAPAGARGGFSPDGRWLAYAINRSNRNNELVVAQSRRRDEEGRGLRRRARLLVRLDVARLRHRAVGGRAGEAQERAEAGAEQDGPAEPRHGRDDDDRRRRVVRVQPGRRATWPSGPTAPSGAGGAAERGRRRRRAAARAAATRRRPTTGRARRSSSAISRPAARRRSATCRSSPGRTPSAGACWRSPSARPARPATACSCSTRRRACCGCSIRRRRSTPASRGARTRADLAVLPREDRRQEGRADLRGAGLDRASARRERQRVYDPAADKTFPAGMRTVSSRRLSWSDDGGRLFLGVAKWDDKLEPAGRGGRGGAGGGDRRSRPRSRSGTPRTSS